MLGQNSKCVYTRQVLFEYVQICVYMPHCPPTQLPSWCGHFGCMYCVLLIGYLRKGVEPTQMEEYNHKEPQ